MAEVIRPAGGLPAEARALLVPENIRKDIHIKGGGVDITGALQQAYEVVAVGYYGVCRRTDSSGNNVQSGQWYGWGDTRYGSMVTAGGIGGYNNASMTWTCTVDGTYRISGYRFSPTRSGVQAMSKGQTVSFTGIQATGIVGSGVSSGCFTIERLV